MRLTTAAIIGLVFSAAAGFAWISPADITNWADYECAPRAVCDSTNRVHLVWFGGAPESTGWRIYYQVLSAGGWSAPTAVSDASSSTPDIAIDSSDDLHVVWHAGGNPEEVYYRKCTGGVWGGAVNLSNSSGVRSMTPRIAVSPTGDDILVAWHEAEQTGGNWDILARRCSGGNWAMPENVSQDSTLSRTADVVRHADGSYYVAWEDTDTKNAFFRKRSAGGSWGTRTAMDVTSGRSYGVALAIDGSGGVHAVWHDDNNGDWDIAYRYLGASGWSPVSNISNNPGIVDCNAHLDVNAAGQVFVAWQDYDNIYYTEKRGSSWRSNYRISRGTYQYSPCVCLDFTGRTHILWQCRMPGSWNVWWTWQDLDFTPPATPTGLNASASADKVYLSWTNASDIDFEGTTVRYSTAGYPQSPTDGLPVCVMPGDPGFASSFVHQGLAIGVTCYYSAFAHDISPNYSAAAHASATPQLFSISDLRRTVPDGAPVDLYSKTVTADFTATDGCIYIRQPDRSSGIRVSTSASGFAPGDVVHVSGRMSTRTFNNLPSEREITGATVTKVLGAPYVPNAEPFAMTCGRVGGGTTGLAPGVKGSVGVNNVGQLVRIAGEVTYKAGSYLFVDDGSRVENLYGLFSKKTGVMVGCPGEPSQVNVGDVVAATGVVEGSIPNSSAWTINRAYLHIRDWNDLQTFPKPASGENGPP